MSRRADQLSSVIHRAVQRQLSKGLADPRVKGAITVTRVNVSPDLRYATIFVSVIPDDAEALTLHGLRSAAKHIRHAISDDLATRLTPELTFKLDESAKSEAEVLSLIARASRELAEVERSSAEPIQTDAQESDRKEAS